jgi:hypothetical protein
LIWLPSFDGEAPVQVSTPASGLDGNDCSQQVARVDGTPTSCASLQVLCHGSGARPLRPRFGGTGWDNALIEAGGATP